MDSVDRPSERITEDPELVREPSGDPPDASSATFLPWDGARIGRNVVSLLYGAFFVASIGPTIPAAVQFFVSFFASFPDTGEFSIVGVLVATVPLAAWVAYRLRNVWWVHFLMLMMGPLISLAFLAAAREFNRQAHEVRGEGPFVGFGEGLAAAAFTVLSVWGVFWILSGAFGMLAIRLRPRAR